MKTRRRAINSKELIDIIRAAKSAELEQLVVRYRKDSRQAVQKALQAAEKRVQREAAENTRLSGLYTKLDAAADAAIIVGLDEVGRGALAGPLVVAAVCLPKEPRITGLNDSKQLRAAERVKVAAQIRACAHAIGLAQIEAAEIDHLGLTKALRKAMLQALEQTELEPDSVLIDGNPLHIHELESCIVGGDASVASIAAASVVAKVYRDELMDERARAYPEYDWQQNKGYGTKRHIQAIRTFGVSPEHRRSFLDRVLADQQSLF